MQKKRYVVGVDFGSLSGRAIVSDADDGTVLGEAVYEYPSQIMDHSLDAVDDSIELGPAWALQDPQDYLDVLANAIPEAVKQSGVDPESIIGIGTDFTASTPLPVYHNGQPLCFDDKFRTRPHAWVKLWKHHAAQEQANRLNELAAKRGEEWLPRYGGRISSEWEFAKALQLYEEDREIYDAMDLWVEAADWIVWQLCGNYTRNSCCAGYKGIYQDGYPSEEFLEELSPGFGSFVAEKLDWPLSDLGDKAGGLTAEAAQLTGLPEGIAVSTGNIDAHVTAPAADGVEPGQLVAIMGTSSCHMVSSDKRIEVPGMCGVVRGGIVAGLFGYEAGQSGVGDIFAWYMGNALPADYVDEAKEKGVSTFKLLADKASEQKVGEHGLVALDWLSGCRSPLMDHDLSGVIVGLTLQTKPEDIYRALVEATAYGTRTIVDGFVDSGVEVNEFIAAGGLIKDPFLMQIYADVLNMPISVIGTTQGAALGAAMHACVAAGIYDTIADAAEAMGRKDKALYQPDADRAQAYERLYQHYCSLRDFFGVTQVELMHDLKAGQRK